MEPMFAMNQRHRIGFWNKPLKRRLGWTDDDVVGKAGGGVLAGCDEFGNRYCSDACPVISITHRGDAVHQFRLRTKSKDGFEKSLEISVLRFILQSSNQIVLVHVVRPVEAVVQPTIPPQRTTDARVRNLTPREMEILTLLTNGQSTRDIAQRLGIAPLTARKHRHNMFEKLEVHSKSEAVSFAYKMHVV